MSLCRRGTDNELRVRDRVAGFTGTMGAAESKSGEGLEDVQEQLKAIRAQEAILLKKMQASLMDTSTECKLVLGMRACQYPGLLKPASTPAVCVSRVSDR